MHQLDHTLLTAFREIFLYIELADSLAENAAYERHATFPARAVLLNTTEHSIERERGSTKLVGQHTRCTGYDTHFGVTLQVVERCLGQYFLDFVDRFGLPDVHFIETREARNQKHVSPINARKLFNELGISHLVIIRIHIAQLHHIVADPGYPRLNSHHRLHFLFGCSLVIAHECKEFF